MSIPTDPTFKQYETYRTSAVDADSGENGSQADGNDAQRVGDYGELTAKVLRNAGWMAGAQGQILGSSVLNGGKALNAIGFDVWWDEWSKVVRDSETDAEVQEQALIPVLRARVESMFVTARYAPTKQALEDAIVVAAVHNQRNPVVDRLRAEHWDGVDRLSRFGHVVFGTPDHDLENGQAALLPRGVVVRALEPGCAFPYIPVIFSYQQGQAKGKFLDLLSPGQMITGVTLAGFEWEKTLGERLTGVSIAEIPEMDSLPPAELRHAKKLATDVVMKFRLPYARAATRHPLSCIFVATTNTRGMLSDIEHRRNPVIEVPRGFDIRLGWLQENRQQIWAQVVHEYDSGAFRVDENRRTVVELPSRLWESAGRHSEQYEAESALRVWLENHLNNRDTIVSADLYTALRDANVRYSNRDLSTQMAALAFVSVRAYVDGARGPPVDP